MKTPTSKSSLDPLYSFLVTLLPSPSTFHPSAFLSGTPSSSHLRIIFNMFPFSFAPLLSGLQRFINFGPRRDGPYPEHVLRHSKASPLGSTLHTMSSPSKCALHHMFSLWSVSFPTHLSASHFPCIFISSLPLAHLTHEISLRPHTTPHDAS